MLTMDLVEKLNTYRLENRITQQVLAKMLGVAFSTMNRWLTRKIEPSMIQRYHIEKFLKNKSKKKK